MLRLLKDWAAGLRRDLLALWLAARDPAVPLLPNLTALVTAGYALSPIDLIPDFVPVLGYVDDLLIVPLGIALTIRLIPGDVMARLRSEAKGMPAPPSSKIAAAIFVLIWAAIALWLSWLLLAYD
ncbi:YkvA family protein [Pacificimonas flava]|uniref:DUF1232 domain-containing protein n=1 Tax=Pacificimonas flava TaxID=1234595 RepID=M2U3K9_9SPHN|nr:YkvA family protein [Pacificimonas flava]EMD82617.1 hypothetical protein C725_2004 [Pacificimonas flava]MBB5281443.1 uncharacterized membrane protein YkvA (DUF1232 family) [Pacificimonas flava]